MEKELNSNRIKLLLCGRMVINDEALKTLLQIEYDIICLKNFRTILDVVTKHIVKLMIVDITKQKKEQLNMFKEIKAKIPNVIIVAINGRENVHNAAEILSAGATDVFPAPYNRVLLTERVNGLLK